MLTFYNSAATTADKNKTIYRSDDLIQYLEKDWDIELEDYAEGEVEMYDDEEDKGVIKVKVQIGYEETVLELLKKIWGN